MKCDICGEKPIVHICEIHEDGTSKTTVTRHLCHAHAVEAGVEMKTTEQSALAMVPVTRELVKFLQTNGRMPSPLELPHRSFTDLSDEQLSNDELTHRITYLQEFADFIERNRRFPTDEELPDQF
jgi:hypothetical protein